jgi:hypothetical protein
MADKLIKRIHDRINFAIGKGESGYFSPEEIDQEVYAVILEMFSEYLDEYPKNKKIQKYLDPFLAKKDESVPSTGQINVPTTEEYIDGVETKDGVEIELLSRPEFAQRKNSQALPVSQDYPIAKIENTQMTILPKDIGQITIHYFEKPTEPEYAYTEDTDSEQFIYNDSNSVDVQFTEQLHPKIVNRVLKRLGINTRDPFMTNVSDQEKATESQ